MIKQIIQRSIYGGLFDLHSVSRLVQCSMRVSKSGLTHSFDLLSSTSSDGCISYSLVCVTLYTLCGHQSNKMAAISQTGRDSRSKNGDASKINNNNSKTKQERASDLN